MNSNSSQVVSDKHTCTGSINTPRKPRDEIILLSRMLYFISFTQKPDPMLPNQTRCCRDRKGAWEEKNPGHKKKKRASERVGTIYKQ